jgi:hypothetical protein
MNEVDKIGKMAALLSAIEIGLGSFLHSLKIPFSGHFLSLNQGLILTKASIEIKDKKSPVYISTTSAILKSLSPSGKKLTPMLAIAAQGQLFFLGVLILGNNYFGRILGIILLSLWSFIQPLGLYLLLFGKDFIFMVEYFIKKLSKVLPVTNENILSFLLYVILAKVILAIIVGTTSHLIKNEQIENYAAWTKKRKKEKKLKKGSPYILALKDLFNPFFIISIFIVIFFFIFSKSPNSSFYWALMRPIAGGYLIFLIIRIYPIENLVERLKEGKYKEVLKVALSRIKS